MTTFFLFNDKESQRPCKGSYLFTRFKRYEVIMLYIYRERERAKLNVRLKSLNTILWEDILFSEFLSHSPFLSSSLYNFSAIVVFLLKLKIFHGIRAVLESQLLKRKHETVPFYWLKMSPFLFKYITLKWHGTVFSHWF